MTRDAAWREDAPHAPLCDSRWCQASYGDESCHAFDVVCIDVRPDGGATRTDLLLTLLSLAVVLAALCAAYVTGQQLKAERCAVSACERVEVAGRSWT